jgi:hypothetical protein
MITITVENDWTSDLFVTVWDLMAPDPQTPALEPQRLNSGEVVLVDLENDGRGYGKVKWRAVDTNNASRVKERQPVSCSAGSTVEVDLLGV